MGLPVSLFNQNLVCFDNQTLSMTPKPLKSVLFQTSKTYKPNLNNKKAAYKSVNISKPSKAELLFCFSFLLSRRKVYHILLNQLLTAIS